MSSPSKALFPWSKTSNAFYPSVTNTSRLIRNARASYTLRPIPPKRTRVKFAVEIRPPPPEYHPWNSKYYQILAREKVRKPMAKNPYQQKQRSLAYATESITTEEECFPSLISPDAVRIEKPFVHQGPERPTPDSVRYLRAHELMPSQRSRMTHSSKASTPSLFPPATKVNASQTPAPVRLLNRAKVRDNPVVLRRPPRRLMINVVRETILPVAVYG